MFNKRIVFILFLFFAVIWTLSLASADDLGADVVNATDDEVSLDLSDDIVDSNSNDVLEMKSDDGVLEKSKKGTFTELQDKIDRASKGSTVCLDKDYEYDEDFGSLLGIKITKQITIDGKGHSIDGRYESALLLINKVNNVVLKNIVFKSGDCSAGNVGVFYSNHVKFKNCKFNSNHGEYGGAVFLTYSDYSSFDGCNFYENYAEYGCALYLDSCNNPSFKNCRFKFNYADYGGALFLDNCYGSTFAGCNFTDAFADYGGALFLDSCYQSSFSNCHFLCNNAYYGGALFLDNCYASSFKKCDFDTNGAEKNGAAIYQENCSSSFDSCRFYDNYLEDYLILGNDYLNDLFWSAGGAIFSIQSVLNVLKCNFDSNGAGMGGGDIYSQYGMIFLEDSFFYDSYAYGFGGSLSFNNDYVKIKSCTFDDCDSLSHGGGAVYCLNSILDSQSSKFKNCYAYYGGAVCSINTDLVFKDNNFESNRAGTIGGTIYSVYGSINLEDSVFYNSSAVRGGAMYITTPNKINNITNNHFLYCSAYRASKIYVDGYYGEIPERGNVYEDIYFVYANFTGLLSEGEYNSRSNILAYVISNSDKYQNDLYFYNNLKEDFISKRPFDSSDDSFHIFDEGSPDDSIIFLDCYNYTDPQISYDVGHSNNEYHNSMSGFEAYIFNLRGDVLDYLHISPLSDDKLNGIDTSFEHIFYSSDIYNENGWSLYPVSGEGKNITVFEKKYDNPYYWICPIDPEEFCNYEIRGELAFHFEDRKLFYDYGNILESKASRYVVQLFNPTYDLAYHPSFYDYYDSYGYVTSVKNQGAGSNCWAFAGIATLEACLKKITGQNYDFSENNAKNLMATSSIYGLNIDSNAGGYDTMFMSYLTSWLGPIGEEYDGYNPTSHMSISFAPTFHIQEIAFLSPRKNSSDNDEFKEAIMKYGAVAATVNWTDRTGYRGFHSVSIVGWDDEYYGYDSLGNYAIGAWIFKNSWGDEWGDYGFGYLSYEQRISGEIAPYLHAYTFVFNDNDIGYQDIYQYDFAGVTDYICSDNDFIYYKNRFTARDDEFLYAFSTYFEKPALFSFSVRINGQDIVMDEENNTIPDKILYSPAGYHTISLGYNLTLSPGDEFEIIIKLLGTDEKYVPVCQADELYKLTYPSNVSFISYNGQDWTDLYDLKSSTKFAYWGNKTDTCQVACIKAFTALWRASSFRWYFNYSNNFLDGKGYDVYHIDGNLSTDGKRSLTIHCNPLKEYNNRDDYVELNFNEGSQILYLKLTSGDAYLNMENWIDGHYRFSARLNSNFFTSNILYFDIILLDRVYATFSELERMIDNADDGALLVLDRDYCYNGGFNGEYISINKSLTIDGRGHVLNGRFKSGIFRIESGCNVTLTNIQFKNGNSGALVSYGNLTVSDCIFTSNSADYGGAIYSLGDCSIVNSQFNDNSARYYGGSVYSLNALNITDSKFKSGENTEIVYFAQDGGDLYLKNNRMLAGSENAATILYDVKDRQYNLQLQLVFTTGSTVKGDYVHLCQIKDGEGNVYRLGDVNVTLMGQNGAINISLGYSRALGGYLFDTSVLDYGTYELTGSLSEGNCIVKDGILYIVRKSVIGASALTKVYGNNKKLTVTLKDDKGKAIKNAYLNVKLNGKTIKIKTNSKGQASLAVKLAPKAYKATVTFAGNTKYYKASKNVKVIIKKATPKMTAKKKTFKLKTKVKKYTITLKNNLGKVMKKVKVTLKVKGKTYKAKTNKKGKATFKIKNLKKKGTFRATIKYAGNTYYKSVSKKVKIKVK